MLKSYIDAEESYRNATLPAVYDSLRTVLGFYGLGNIDKVFFNGDAEISNELFSSKDDGLRANQYSDMKFLNKLYVVLEEETTVFNTGFSNPQNTITNRPAWRTEDGKISIVPAFDGRKYTLDINAHFRTRQEARNFRNRLETARNRQMVDMNFNAHVHYPLNYTIIYFLTKVHARLVKAGKTTDDFAVWFFKNARMPFMSITNEALKNPTIVLAQRKDEIAIIMEEPTVALTRRGQEYLGRYEVSFRYSFFWQEHTQWELSYPMMIEQQPLDECYMPAPQLGYRNGFNPHAFIELASLNLIARGRFQHTPFYQRIPEYDTWVPPAQRYLDTQLTAVTVLEDVDTQTLINLKELPDWKWDDDFIQHIINYRDHLFDRHEDVFHVKVYSDDVQVLKSQLKIDENGNLILTRKPTMGNIYRLVIFVDCDLKGYHPDHVTRIVEDDHYKKVVIPKLFPWFRWRSDEILTPDDWYDRAKETDRGDGVIPDHSTPKYMMNVSLIAKR